MKVLVTRPEPGASATAARLEGMGHEPVLWPCLKITQRPARLPERPGAIVITSGQAVPGLPAAYRDVTVFCVGDATASRLREAGFQRVLSAAGDAQDLARLIIGHRLAGLHVMAVGARHGMTLAVQLRAARIPLVRRVVYAARPVRRLEPAVARALAGTQAALFYSAETVRAFAWLRPPHTATMMALALSPAVAEPLQGLPWSEIRVALAPTEADLLALLT